MSRKFFTLLSGLLLISLLLTACNSNGQTQLDGPITITYYRRGYVEGGTDVGTVTTRQAIDKFMEDHENIQIEIVGIPWTEEGTAKLEAALLTKSDVNLMAIANVSLPTYVERGLISPAEDFMSAEDKEDFLQGALDACTVNGKVYGWPLWVTAVAVYGNNAIFEERGIEPPTLEDPWTYDEFVEAAKQLTFTRDDGTQIYGFSTPSMPGMFGFLPMLYMDGSRILNQDVSQFIQNQPEGISALQKIADLSLVHQVTPPDYGAVDQATVIEQFKEWQNVAMIMETPATLANLEAAEFDFSVMPPPVGESGEIVTTGGFGVFAVLDVEDDAAEEAAHLLAQYLTSTQVSLDVEGWQRAPGIRKSNTSYGTTPARETIVKLVPFGIYEPSVNISSEVVSMYNAALQSVLLGEKTAEEALNEIAPVYQAALDENK